jgi:signal transduction histidine kinase
MIVSIARLSSLASKPVQILADVISYASHPTSNLKQPEFNNLGSSRELIESLTRQIYDMASSNNANNTISTADATAPLLNNFGIPMIGLNSQAMIVAANKSAGDYIGLSTENMLNKPIFDILKLSFQDDDTLERWLQSASTQSVTNTKQWERVKHTIDDDSVKHFDMIASYSQGSASGVETYIAFFDKTTLYAQEEQEISFVALAVHELRTPLTIMRGYIEVFEDELGESLNDELKDFMFKMQASAQQLTAFVSNILNVARIEEDQLAVKLREENIPELLKTAIADLQLRASIYGKKIELSVDESIPTVGIDRISIHEVVNNLVENAIKYSGESKNIVVRCGVNNDGMVEVSIQDFGIGIPASVMPQLFKKFKRSHKSRIQVVGTGLGLYISKALINAHGGNIWVRSKEGEGSIFSFTVLPFSQISAEQQTGEDGIIRGAHGWIKNHSLYRN